MLNKAAALVKKVPRRLWMKYALRGAGNDNAARLDLAYRMEDPWNMQSEMEQARFRATNDIIRKAFGQLDSVLELGCGEGHQTEYLARVCKCQYAIDISPQAIERARQRLPGVQFGVADVFTQPWTAEGKRFDLVTACEMLYYLRDPGATIERMRALGRNGLVTFFAPACGKLGEQLDRVPGLHKGWFHHGKTAWLVGWWHDA